MKSCWGLLLIILLASGPVAKAFSGDTIRYDVTFPNAVHHEAKIEIEVDNLKKGDPLIFNMSRSSPGRYAMHMFGKNVYNVMAEDAKGRALKVNYKQADQWVVSDHKGYVKFKYTLFADYADGTYDGINERFALLNIPATFVWAAGHENNPILVKFNIPDGSNWKVSTQLKQLSGNDRFCAPYFQYFMDSPTVLADRHMYEFSGGNFDGQHFRMSIFTVADSSLESKYAQWASEIVLEQKAIFGEFPQYDYGEYTFLCNYMPGFHGDGMEHRNSTLITSSAILSGNALPLVGTVSHEFFHCWNVERLRPKSLEPFNFRDINTSGELWFAEGFTSYYGPLTLCRTGIYDQDMYLSKISGLLNYVLQSPGTGKFSPVTMSKRAPFVDAAANVDETNFENTFTSYYPYGAVIALALDLSLREKFGIALDDYMRLLWQQFGREEIPYTNSDLLETLIKLTNDKSFATTFFDKYIFGTEVPDFSRLLKNAGLELRKQVEDSVSIGNLPLRATEKGLKILSRTKEHTPAYQSGMIKGDVITKVDSFNIRSSTDYKNALKHFGNGDSVTIEYVRGGSTHSCNLNLSQTIRWEIVPAKNGSDEEETFRKKWLGSRRAE